MKAVKTMTDKDKKELALNVRDGERLVKQEFYNNAKKAHDEFLAKGEETE